MLVMMTILNMDMQNWEKHHEKNRKAEFLYKALYKKPYYAHLEVINSENNQIEHYYLSDCNYLDAPKNIGEKGMYGELMPFSSDTPFMKALLEVHVNEDGEMVEYQTGVHIKLKLNIFVMII